MSEHLRVAVAHEWFSARAGSEKVFEQLAVEFPEADLYCLTYQPGVNLFDPSERRVATTMLDHPFLRERRAMALPVMPAAWRAIRREPYDLVITSSHAFARYFARPSDGIHLSYTHTPMRYAWSPELDQRGRRGGRLARPARAALRAVDRRSIDWTDSLAANSQVVADRVRRHYNTTAQVIPPPVEIDRFRWTRRGEGYLAAISRFVDYKRLDLAIGVAERVGKALVILGQGPQCEDLQAAARSAVVDVEVVNAPTDAQLATTLAGADAFIFPAQEDFGIVAVEAQACGVPVLAVQGYGADDSVIDGTTGVLVASQSIEDLTAGMERLLSANLSRQACRNNAVHFSPHNFRAAVRKWATEAMERSPLSGSWSLGTVGCPDGVEVS